MKEAIVSDGVETDWQSVLQVATNELDRLDFHYFDLATCAILHGDRYVAAIGFEYPRVGYGAFANISAEVLEGVDSVSK
ncbi:hypothetical protein MLD52_23305, partial [Puniceicoccaceae bacterium K14]|nr:hypothetical protein [Puniceicoccaceae bacterium K14]